MMKKKFFAVALATTMAVSTVMTASAETISGAWWTSWSQGYEVADGETVEFDMELKGGDAVWNNVAAVFVNGKTTGTTAPADEVAGYKEYAVVRGDNWGWGGGDNKTVDGNDISYQGGIADLGDADFIATMKDAHLEVSVTREGNDIEYTYTAIGANGIETTRTVNFTSDLSEGCYVFFVSDGSTVDISLVEEDPSEDPTDDTKKDDTTEATTKKDDAAKETTTKKEESTTKKEESTTAATSVKTEATTTAAAAKETTTAKTNSPKTGDTAPVAALMVVALGACGAVIASKKKNA